MIRLFTAAALATLLASPVLAQNVSPGDSPGSSMRQNQGSPSAPGSADPMSRAPGTAGQIPGDCAPNDPRPECQTAQLPGQDAPDQSQPQADQGGAGLMTPPAERAEPEPPGGQGSSGGMGR